MECVGRIEMEAPGPKTVTRVIPVIVAIRWLAKVGKALLLDDTPNACHQVSSTRF